MPIAPVLLMTLVLGAAPDHPSAAVSLSARSTAPWSAGRMDPDGRPDTHDVRRVARSIRSGPQSSFRGVRATRTTAVVIGTVLGLVAGGLVGAALDANCACDSPGFAGLVVGAPIGAAVGAVATFRLTR